MTRKQIAELLIKWHMPTRQAFINDLKKLMEKEKESCSCLPCGCNELGKIYCEEHYGI